MATPLSSRLTMLHTFGLLLALVGLLGQLSSGNVAQRRDDTASAVAALAAASVDCHLATPAHDHRSRHRSRPTEPSMCPAQLALEHHAFTIAPPIDVAVTAVVIASRTGLPPPSRGPPQPTARVGEPRAPPTQV